MDGRHKGGHDELGSEIEQERLVASTTSALSNHLANCCKVYQRFFQACSYMSQFGQGLTVFSYTTPRTSLGVESGAGSDLPRVSSLTGLCRMRQGRGRRLPWDAKLAAI
jgi:hypothetical protein